MKYEVTTPAVGRKPNPRATLIVNLGLAIVILISVAMFSPTLSKPIPPGVDASVYLNEAHWSIKHQTIPKPSQPIDHGSRSYTAPLTSVNLVMFYQLTGADIAGRLFSYYEIGLVFLLVFSSYLVGRTFSTRISLLFPIGVIANYAVSRLFIGSTVSNLLAFTYINLIFFAVAEFFLTQRARTLLLVPPALAAIYLTHNYLTAPILFPVLFMYFIFLYIVRPEMRTLFSRVASRIPRKVKGIMVILFVLLVFFLLIAYIPVFKEARFSFWKTSSEDRFLGPVTFDQFGSALGPTLILFGGLGLLLYSFKPRENLLGYRVFPVLWLGILLVLLQLNRIGVNFYFERIVFLGSIFISFFAAYLIGHKTFKEHMHPRVLACVIAIFITLVITQGAVRIKELYAASNRVTTKQIAALLWLRDHTPADAVVFSQTSAVSQTAHDFMVANRTIMHFTTVKDRCFGDPACQAFAAPDEPASFSYFRSHDISTFLFLRPGEEGNELLDRLLTRYANAGYKLAMANEEAIIYQLPSALILYDK